MTIRLATITGLIVATMSVSACTTTQKTVGGAVVGGVGGAVLGDAIAGTGGAVVGGVAGAVAGGAVGRNLH
ncbi:hypothetical protein VSX64_09710 [Aurantimonas sp. C2-6-R+9]|uniref:hypothetical protein n=1 Tax=unclassified Aurantimonas TaxID=2638230 RepID=UPI002E1799CD|nr:MULTISPECIES: hypothetical protein [unclassified Aurantimonas]MEC5291392.1 hypothetical protein [Aurantimonas sp. C2-3-R2]MEC5323786.1 hypothetical protein [Aurantimonas sp. A3-2-R12]MEC5381152.1 hypothetical protein [Aurantimonas sp. C2-6-R+9]MEC5412492.1 hypothetical protein [Aurantimonas sp. C2-4-R8]